VTGVETVETDIVDDFFREVAGVHDGSGVSFVGDIVLDCSRESSGANILVVICCSTLKLAPFIFQGGISTLSARGSYVGDVKLSTGDNCSVVRGLSSSSSCGVWSVSRYSSRCKDIDLSFEILSHPILD